jgi:coproporphyrinogen III oxidase-like Fe-S oxidoreductase
VEPWQVTGLIHDVIPSLVARSARRSLSRLMYFEDEPGTWPPTTVAPDRVRQLYVHIPFCPHLCPFCTFHRVRFNADRSPRYFAALRAELVAYRELGHKFTDVYIGGGTPTSDPPALRGLLATLHEFFPVELISVETNPSDLTGAMLDMLSRAGIQRLSVGVQSFDDSILKSMGRYASYGSSSQIIEHIERAQGRFETLNLDMMFNLPGQSRDSLQRDLEVLTRDLDVDQVSYYPLIIAPSAQRSISLQMGGAQPDREHEYYELIRSTLSASHPPSTVWCFSRGRAAIDEYIVAQDNYIGAGSGAFSFVDGVMAANTFSIRSYVSQLGRGVIPVVRTRRLTDEERIRLDFLLKLFGLSLDKAATDDNFAGRFQKILWKELLAMRVCGFLKDTGPTLQLTQRGMYLWVVLMREFLNSVNELRAAARHQIRAEIRELEVIPTAEPTPGQIASHG